MDRDEVIQITQEQIKLNSDKNVFDVSPIPVHSHTGTESPQVDPNNLINSSLYFAVQQTVLSSAQILGLHSNTPISLVAPPGTPGSGVNMLTTMLIVEGITAKIYAGSVAYTGANNLEFRYTDASGAKVTADIPNTFINTVANTTAIAHVAGITTQFTPVSSSPIVVCVPTADPGGAGNGKIIISVKYRRITL